MSAHEIAHILTITLDPDNADDWTWELECPYQPDDLEADRRPCRVWFGCDCHLTEEQKTAIAEGDVGPCPAAPKGEHYETPNGIGWLGKQCWARYCDDTSDQVADIRREHGAGTFEVSVIGSQETVELEVLARVEAVAS